MEILGSYVIILSCVVLPATLITTYAVAVTSGHVDPFLPFISHTGDEPVEKCIFSLGINVTAGLYAFIAYLRHEQILKIREVSSLNNSSLVLAAISSAALSLTASCQESNFASGHAVFAVTSSVTGLAYFWHQTILSYKLKGKICGKAVTYLRISLSTVSTALHVTATSFICYLVIVHHKSPQDTKHWPPGDPGWGLHVSVTLSEWFIVIVNQVYIATFFREFSRIYLRRDEIIFAEEQNKGE